ncbi:condensation domain-containing protein [Myxococcus sp. MxC21-1]|nr:condensation domain-containing protein [Myxococcus sp. MxC21-1]WNZ65994.1 condensation domain-containing protein [Myxococcus sp. MxC21-1]
MGPVALTPIQHWFFNLGLEAPHHWNMSLLLEARTSLDAALLERALAHLLGHHDALRLGFASGEDGWHQAICEPGARVTVARVDLSAVPEVERPSALSRHAEAAQRALRLEGPLVQAVLLEWGAGHSTRLMLAVHHLVVDAVSWRILLEDRRRRTRGSRRGTPWCCLRRRRRSRRGPVAWRRWRARRR